MAINKGDQMGGTTGGSATRLTLLKPHPTVDRVHEDVKLIHAVEGRRDDTGQSKHEADGDEAALPPR